ncbi:MAG: tetratricopeptide repeat protein [Thermoguttaceae bacterium]
MTENMDLTPLGQTDMGRKRKNAPRQWPGADRPLENAADSGRPPGGLPHKRAGPAGKVIVAVAVFLVVATAAVFAQTLRHDFVNCDDDQYVYENPHLIGGLTAKSIAWAFTASHSANWHPLTWMSHMLDWQLYRLEPGGHHFTSVLLHAAAAVLLFLVMLQMTGRLWPSALVAAVFAVHPLHVESVAWIAERKDVLSGLLFMMTLAAYASYASRPFSWARYLPVVLCCALGLMAKPMLVTLPLVLLLLDYWPLGRLDPLACDGWLAVTMHRGPSPSAGTAPWPRLLLEKAPLVVLAAISCKLTLWAQSAVGAIKTDELALPYRVANALVSYVVYIGQMFYPAGLVVHYPHPARHISLWAVAGALAVLMVLSIGAVWCRRKCPYLLVGWFWYLVMLVPVVGLVQVGAQARADRYTYLPQIGLYVAIAWAVSDLSQSRPRRAAIASAAAAAVLAVLMLCAWRQTAVWRDSVTLWTHAVRCSPGNDFAHNNLGVALRKEGKLDEALEHYRQAVELNPRYVTARTNVAVCLYEKSVAQKDDALLTEAIAEYQAALELAPENAELLNDYAVALHAANKPDEAFDCIRQAVRCDPNHALARKNLGMLLAQRGRYDEAVTQYQKALELNPSLIDAHRNLAVALTRLGQFDQALPHLKAAVQLDPADVAPVLDLAFIWAASPHDNLRNGAAAVDVADYVCKATEYQNARALGVLAAAHAETGNFEEARNAIGRALALVEGKSSPLEPALRECLRLYRAGKPCRSGQ